MTAGPDIWALADDAGELTGGQMRDLREHFAAIEARMVEGSNPFDRSSIPAVNGDPKPKARSSRYAVELIAVIGALAVDGLSTTEIARVAGCPFAAARRFRRAREQEGRSMLGVNVCVLGGHVEAVERAETKAGKAFARVRFTVTEPRRDGAIKAVAELSAWGKVGEEALTLRRGQEAILSCRISPREWKGKDGTSRISNELTVVSIQTDKAAAPAAAPVERRPEPAAPVGGMGEDECPF